MIASLALAFGLSSLLAAPRVIRTAEWMRRVKERRSVYAMARARATETGRRLVVVGDPGGGVTHAFSDGEGYGDVCVDLEGCDDAPNGVVQIKADLAAGLDLPADQFVVFVCYVLELIPEIDQAWAEILRLAGSSENVFVLWLNPRRDMAAFSYADQASGSRVLWDVLAAPMGNRTVLAYRPLLVPRGILARRL